jgi:F-type H+-transporting ATPase subunit alpha
VSRVGGKAQLPAYRTVASDLRLSYAQFEEFEAFARFGTRLDPETRRALERGRRVREILKQSEHELLSVGEQIAVLFAATKGWLDDVPMSVIAAVESRIRTYMQRELPDLCDRIDSGHDLDAQSHQQLRSMIKVALTEYSDTGTRGRA